MKKLIIIAALPFLVTAAFLLLLLERNHKLTVSNMSLSQEVTSLIKRNKEHDERAFRLALAMKDYYELQISDNETTLKKVDNANQELINKLSKAGIENIQMMETIDILSAKLNNKKLKALRKSNGKHK